MSTRPRPADIISLLTIALCWGSAFLVTKYAVASLPPVLVALGRVAIAAIVLAAAVRVTRSPLPRTRRSWLLLLLVAGSGTAAPFVLIAWGQTRIESATASILMGLVPLMTLVLAHYLTATEKMTPLTVAGVITGFAGIVLMFGGVDLAVADQAVLAKAAILAGGFGYAVSGIGVRHLRQESAISVAAMIMILSFLILLPLAIISVDWAQVTPAGAGLWALLYLGLFPSALAAILLVRLIRSVGVTFFSFNNFLVPVIGVFLAAAIGKEAIGTHQVGGLLLVLAGIAVSQWPAYRRRAPHKS